METEEFIPSEAKDFSIEKIDKNEKLILDDKWYEKFKTLTFDAYEYFDGDKNTREQQKENFISNKTINPKLDYPKINLEKINNKEKEFINLKKELLLNEPNKFVKIIYRWRINEKIAELRMLKCTANNEDKKFKRYSEFIYGEPSQETFNFIIQNIYQKINSEPNNPTGKELSNVLSDIDNIHIHPMSLISEQSEQFQKVKKQTNIEIGDLVNLPETAELFNALQIKSAFEEALQKLGVEGWHVLLTENDKPISVSQPKRTIEIFKGRELNIKKLKELIAHEIGTHVQRRHRGENSKLMLLGLGLDRYEKGEEGIATMREQVISDNLAILEQIEGHLAISLVYGLDGKGPRDFRQTYEILIKYYKFIAPKSNAKDRAWNRCVRTFRGTNCAEKGVCLTKDIAYAEGNFDTWYVVGEKPEEVLKFSIGKYDPANLRHQKTLTILGQEEITDGDLKDLENMGKPKKIN